MTITIDEEMIEAEVYRHKINESNIPIYLVKVSFLDIGLYINSITAQPSTKFPSKELWVQLPRYKAYDKWRRPMEVSKSSSFFALIETVVIRAVDIYTSEDREGYTPSDEEMDKPISLDDIPW